jgi:hypothetical protein
MFPSTIKTRVFKAGPEEEVLSSIDVSVAFLQADKYGDEESPSSCCCSTHKKCSTADASHKKCSTADASVLSHLASKVEYSSCCCTQSYGV